MYWYSIRKKANYSFIMRFDTNECSPKFTFDHSSIQAKQNQWSHTVIFPLHRTSSKQIMHGEIEVLRASFVDLFLGFLRDILSAFSQILSILFAFPKWRAVVVKINNAPLIGPLKINQSQTRLYLQKESGTRQFCWYYPLTSFIVVSQEEIPSRKHGRYWGHASWYRKPQ